MVSYNEGGEMCGRITTWLYSNFELLVCIIFEHSLVLRIAVVPDKDLTASR